MPIVNLDLTKPNVVPDGTHKAVIQKVDYITPQPGDLNAKGEQKSPYIKWTFFCPELPDGEQKFVFHITSVKAPFTIKPIMDAAGAPYDASGFDPALAVGKMVLLTVSIVEDPMRGPQNNVVKVEKI